MKKSAILPLVKVSVLVGPIFIFPKLVCLIPISWSYAAAVRERK